MHIPRHAINAEYLSAIPQIANETFEDLPKFLASSRRSPIRLGTLANEALAAASFEYVVDPSSKRIPDALQLSADARNAMFATALNPAGPVEARLGTGDAVVYNSPADESHVNIGAWLSAFFLNVICGDVPALHQLCQIPNELMLSSTTKGSEYNYLYKDALCAYVNETGNVVDKIMAALRATDPARSDIFDVRRTLALGVPQLELLMYVVTENPEFNEAMCSAVEKHRSFWSKPDDNTRNFHGFVSPPLTALAALGRDSGLHTDADSPYLAMHLVKL